MLGVYRYHRAFIPGYANIVRPLNNLLKKDAPFVWGKEQEEAMDQLAYAVSINPVLSRLNYEKPFYLEVNVSQYATGAVLSQKDDRGCMQIVGSVSHSFLPAERNYNIHDRELLAIIHGLRAWHHLFLSSPHVVTIYTNHKNLMYYRHAQRITWRVARYLGELANYHITLVHKPGASNCTDAFSQQPDYDTGANDNENVTVLPTRLFANAMELLSIEEQVFEAQKEHKEQITNLQKEYALDKVDGKWFYQAQPVVPDEEELKRQILGQYHDHQLAGHPGIANTVIAVTREFWWPDV
jgi:hypothetical protein